MKAKLLILALITTALFSSLTPPKPTIYYRNVFWLGYGNNMFRYVNASEKDMEILFNATNENEGYYIDTLTKELFYHNYNFTGYKTAQDLPKTRRIGKITLSPILPQTTITPYTSVNVSKFFKNKIDIEAINKKNILYSISYYDDITNKTQGEWLKKPIIFNTYIDVNNDGIKEKLTFSIKYHNPYDEDPPFGQTIFLDELKIIFSAQQDKRWKVYDEIIVPNLNSDLNNIQVIQITKNIPPVIYINSEYNARNGNAGTSKVLLFGNIHKTPIQTIKYPYY